MTTIGRLQQALAAVTNDVTVAAANFNFDFALVKCEPPQEYHPLGTILSAKRKHDAELGPIHITARRLGALFEGVCPNTPKLVQAYGIRTSEIARLANDKISSIYAESIFAAHTGIDATTIWAAATSSKAALPVHLLACMLARQWSPEEAISIWVELIKERREVIARKLEAGDLMSFALATAATQQEIPRQQLAEWDASARAWLQTADSVKEYQQIQLLQILKNISLPVNSNPQLYTSVVDAWVSALDTIEKLICGMPQAVNTGACFLALASWHLYPDITAFGARNVEVEMKDPLFASGGVLSLGLIPSPADSRGVYWSLPLAYLRHYGAPIHKERTLSADFSRITCSQMLQVVLGCLLGTWEVPRESNKEAAQFIASLNQLLQESADLRDKVWLRLTLSTLASFASIFLNATGEEAETNAKLVFHGRKRAHLFFGDLKNSEHASSAMVGTSKDVERPCFGLLDLHKLLSCLKDTESRLQLLRNLAKRVPNVRGQDIILRYVLDEQDIKGRTGHPQRFKLGSSRLSRETPQRKRCHDAYLSDEKLFPILRTDETREKDYIGYATFSKSCFICLSPINAHYCYEGQINRPREGHVEYPANLTRGGAGFWADPHPGSAVCPRAFFKENGAILEVCIGAPPDSATEVRQFELVMGDQNSMSIMVATGESVQKWHATSPQPNISDLLWCLENNLFSKQKLAEQVASSQKTMDRVRTVAAVSKIYDPLPDTTLSINVFERPLLQAKWAQDQRHNGDYVREGERWFTSSSWFHTWMDRGRTFAVITYFQSGGLDVAPDQLKDVIALSSGDSLFIAKALLCDPLQSTWPWEVQRVLGNVGKPGVTMLVPPHNPMIKDADLSKWRTATLTNFDGNPGDYFGRTSLHLWFTDYYVAIHHESTGLHDGQVFFLESVISVRDAGQWIADIDVLRALKNPNVYKTLAPIQCTCLQNAPPKDDSLLPVESWDGVLDQPDGKFVIRAHKNWVARLATTCVSVQLRQTQKNRTRISICPPSVCWGCIKHDGRSIAYIY